MTFVLAKDRMLLNICHGGGLGNRLLEGKDKLAFKIKSHINNTTSFKKDSKLTGHELFAIYQLFLMTFNSLFHIYIYIYIYMEYMKYMKKYIYIFPPYYFPLSGRKKFSSTLLKSSD